MSFLLLAADAVVKCKQFALNLQMVDRREGTQEKDRGGGGGGGEFAGEVDWMRDRDAGKLDEYKHK